MTTQTRAATRGASDARTVHTFFEGGGPDVPGLADWLDARPFAERVAAVRALGRKEQARLFEAAAGLRPLSLAHLVPASVEPMHPVIHYGKNSLPMFSRFEKRFLKPEAGAEELWGYNEQPLRGVVGPGYFVVREAEQGGELLIDYIEHPPRAPGFWPPLKSNDRGLARLVYGGMIDRLRGVTQDVSIGRATRKGEPTDNWFVLLREASPR